MPSYFPLADTLPSPHSSSTHVSPRCRSTAAPLVVRLFLSPRPFHLIVVSHLPLSPLSYMSLPPFLISTYPGLAHHHLVRQRVSVPFFVTGVLGTPQTITEPQHISVCRFIIFWYHQLLHSCRATTHLGIGPQQFRRLLWILGVLCARHQDMVYRITVHSVYRLRPRLHHHAMFVASCERFFLAGLDFGW